VVAGLAGVALAALVVVKLAILRGLGLALVALDD
jgi:hypothetical protein